MSSQVVAVDLFGLVLVIAGCTMAFRQACVRRLLGRERKATPSTKAEPEDDPLTYVLRIAGVMIMIFGFVIAGMMTLLRLS